MLRAVADTLATTPEARGHALTAALDRAAGAAWGAVAAPVEGTLLSVAGGAARAAADEGSDELVSVARAAARGASEALALTPTQLSVLARAGVVDAGGRGLVVLLDALVEVVSGAAPADPPASVDGSANADPPANLDAGASPPAGIGAPPHGDPGGDSGGGPGGDSGGGVAGGQRPGHVREAGSVEFGYEVQFLLEAPDWAVERLKSRLAGLGDSLVVVGDGEDTWNVHVHVNDVGAAIEAGVEAGRPYRISVTRFEDQMAAGAPRARGAVVVAAGDGLAELFRAEGAVTVPGPAPSTGEILAAIRATAAGQVVVLPGGRATQSVAALAAEQARIEGRRVGVVPIRSPVQALAALAVRDEGRRFEDDMIAMAEAAGACRYAEVCRAGKEAVTVAGVCRPGDILGLVEGEVNLIGQDLYGTCRDLLDRLLAGGGELVTLLTGTDAPPELAGLLAEHLGQRWPFVEVQTFDGGQPRYPLLVGVE
jgi:DAK2 domain fusion protein YloV